MTYKINGAEMEIPELAAFEAEYLTLCRKHEMRFIVGEYSYDGGSYVTVGPLSLGGFRVNVDEASNDVACIRQAREKTYAMREAKEEARQKQLSVIKTAAPDDELTALEGLLRHMPTGHWSDELFAAKAAAEKAIVKLRTRTAGR